MSNQMPFVKALKSPSEVIEAHLSYINSLGIPLDEKSMGPPPMPIKIGTFFADKFTTLYALVSFGFSKEGDIELDYDFLPKNQWQSERLVDWIIADQNLSDLGRDVVDCFEMTGFIDALFERGIF